MSETSSTHHKIKAEWTKASESENSKRVEDENCRTSPAEARIKIIEQIVIYPSQKSVKCHYCDKNFNNLVILEHQKIHDAALFHCPDCNKKFKRKSSLRKHSYLHKGKFKYECKECNLSFIDLSKYELHKNTRHKTKDSLRYQCKHTDCDKSFASPEYLRRHQVTHSSKHHS